jgi:hypothetical protein
VYNDLKPNLIFTWEVSLKFTIDTTTERIENTGGLVLAGEIAGKAGLDLNDPRYDSIPHKEVLRSLFGLLVQGRTSYEEIALFRGNDLFKNAFDLKYVPARETLRIYLNKIAATGDMARTALHEVNRTLLKKVRLTPVRTKDNRYIPVDCDVSPFDNSRTKKEGVSRTYKGFDGYAPIFSYIGAEGYMLDCELRKGKQHCQKGTPDFLRGNIQTIEELNPEYPVLFRLDGGNDSIDTLKPLMESGHFFLIKRNPRKESPEYWLERAQSLGTLSRPREGKNVYTGVMTVSHPKSDGVLPDVDIVFKITERLSDRQGNPFLFPEVEIETYWTNLFEDPETIFNLYHDHGTSEQFHSELKTDMDVERLPSGKMSVNALVLQVAMIAFNSLRFIGQKALEYRELLPVVLSTKRKRLRKVITDLISVGCKYVPSGRRNILRLWEGNPWLPVFRELYFAFQNC